MLTLVSTVNFDDSYKVLRGEDLYHYPAGIVYIVLHSYNTDRYTQFLHNFCDGLSGSFQSVKEQRPENGLKKKHNP